MQLYKTIPEVRAIINIWRKEELKFAFVPTMGYLHQGHLSLIKIGKKLASRVIASIFVNPKQFGPKEDFNIYPRDLTRDIKLLESAGCDALFFPSEEEIYPEGFCTSVHVSGLTENLCGAFRPGHFDGVATVVMKFLNIITPDYAMFGLKDAQQAIVIKQMCKDMNLPVEIVFGKTVREGDGLAMSSRNIRLTPEDRKKAYIINKSLNKAKEAFESNTYNKLDEVCEMVKQEILKVAPDTKIEYISIVDPKTLKPLQGSTKSALIVIALYLGGVRLIDNIIAGEYPFSGESHVL